MVRNCPLMTMCNEDYRGIRCMLTDCAWWVKEYDCCCIKALVRVLSRK